MNDWAPILKLARYRLLILIRTLITTVPLCIGAIGAGQYLQGKLVKMQGQLAGMQAARVSREQDLAYLQANIDKYRELKHQGLTGQPKREAWIEYLIATRKRVGLPDALNYTMHPSKPLDASAADEPSAAMAADTTNPDRPMAHDLEFELRDIHEKELLDFMTEFLRTTPGRVRVENCLLTEPKPSGLTAKCTLRFITLPDPVTGGAPN